MPRFKDAKWDLPESEVMPCTVKTWEQVGIAIMMDLRDELKKLNTLLQASNLIEIPYKLGRINRALEKMVRPKSRKIAAQKSATKKVGL